ncbi:MAG: glycosyltransferase family 4 protein [Bacillus sp. (in: Bacteria)]|nr:glycosyltransferase family 4 protein [Bacillus sp. (in: firmicutes)]MCM1425448.1 glycosyltransferase family 4 protein [Eubacterium sp.]
MSRVLILINSSGGLYDFRNEFVEALLKDNEVFVSAPDDVKIKELLEEGCQVIHTPINRRGINPIEDLKLYQAYHNMMKELQPDLVITYTIKPNIYGGFCAGRMKIPYITTITGLGGAFDKKGLFLQLIIHMYRAGMKKAACVFFQNAENRNIFKKFGIVGRFDRLVMGSGVSLKHHVYEEYPKREETHFLFVGRVMKERGILEFLGAAKQLHSDTVFFDILGYCDEDYQETLEELEKEGVIRQLGFHTEVHSYLADASAVVVASFHEGMSNALIEAAATGRPAIASNISGCMEAFEEGRTGFGFTPGNTEELVLAMKKFLALSYEERAEMGRAARQKMEREFDRKLVTAAYMDEVHRILDDK